jgi:hypothetical protein
MWLTGRRASDDEEAGEFRAGVAEGTDPRPLAEEFGPVRETATRMSSPWANSDPCTTCGQTFRVGDRVVVDERGVRHLDPRLGCAVERRSAAADAERREFSAGLRDAWPAAGVDLVELTEDDWQVARPGPARKQRCIQCGETFRAGEIVVICPCHPRGDRDDPRRCGQAIHRDPAAGLPCWEEWCPSGVVTLCPVNHTPVRQVADVTVIRRRP